MKDPKTGARPPKGLTASRARPRQLATEPAGTMPPSLAAGMRSRRAAVEAISGVLQHGRSFDEAFADSAKAEKIDGRDRAFARAISAGAIRHKGTLDAVIANFLEKPLPKDSGRLPSILLAAAAQLLILKTPPHAAISIAVDQCRADRRARRFDRLANAVLRRVSEKGGSILADLDTVARDVPAWMLSRWRAAYGKETAKDVAVASLREAPLDISVKGDAELWATRMGGVVVNAGTVRLTSGGRVDELPGFSEGVWWVQDAAAAFPARLFGNVQFLDIADLCAAPGGKTAQLASAGARVVAVDQSAERMERLQANLVRLGLVAEPVVADALLWSPGRLFDGVLVDAPCTATGTIRRHPDIMHLKRELDVQVLAQTQAKFLDAAARLLKPGGRLVYCTCSLEPEEGPGQIAPFLARHPDFALESIEPGQAGVRAEFVTDEGTLRTLPTQLGDLPDGLQGLDGFFAAVLKRRN